MGTPHIAGMLQYSEKLRAEIEEHLLKLYAPVFIKSLEATVKESGKRLAQVEGMSREMKGLADELEQGADPSVLMELVRLMAPLAQDGVLEQFGIRPSLILELMKRGDVQQLKKQLDRVRLMAMKMRKEARKALGGKSEGMKADIEKWKEHYDPAYELRQGEKPKTLEIELKDEHFPFLGDKFRRQVKKLRGEDADIFDDIKTIKVELARLPMGAIGAWSSELDALLVSPPELKPYDHVRDQLDHVLTHELRHTTQGVMARALGVSHYTFDEQGRPHLFYRPGPGMAPRKMLNPKFTQRLVMVRDHPEAAELIAEAQARGMGPDDVYRLDDLEFYTHLGDTVRDFRKLTEASSWTPEQRKLASDIFLGKTDPPEGREAIEKWVQENDPTLDVLSKVQRQHPFLAQLKAHSPDKFKKAVKEFSKATELERGAQPQPEGLEKLWEMFLEERYDGGKEKVRNPNPDTRESHPDISVSYLMRQDAPTYQSGRRRVRQEFAGWRARRQRPAPSPGAGRGIFAPPA